MAEATRYLFFTGKGGVGKTSLACATAVKYADSGKRVLLVSTDPASNLSDVLGCLVDDKIGPVKGLTQLFAVNIDPEHAAESYRSRVIQPLADSLPEQELKKIQENLSGACTTEIASFDEFSRFISGEVEGDFDVIIFDTAPTGHTLRLLELPAAWTSFTDENPDGASCLGPTSALKSGKERYQKVVDRLRDSEKTTFYIVTRADQSSLREAARTSHELRDLGMNSQVVYINGVFKSADESDKLAKRIEIITAEQLHSIPENLKGLEQMQFPLLPYNVLGIQKLRSLFDPQLQKNIIQEQGEVHRMSPQRLPDLNTLAKELSSDKHNGLIMVMGKGGVGKTITAATLAVLLAQEGKDVLLTTTDPAAHIQDFIDQLVELPGSLQIEKIDPKLETQRYTEKIIANKGVGLDAEAQKLLREDLKSPCTEEVAVFHAFSKALNQSKRKFVVIDTAPTGHTLLLLDTAGTYHRDIMRNNANSERIKTPYMLLQNEELSKILLVSLPETTPMREAESLQQDLNRAGIKPYAWVINQSLSMLHDISDPLLLRRSEAEIEVIDTIKTKHARRVFGIPYIAEKQLLPAVLESFRIHVP